MSGDLLRPMYARPGSARAISERRSQPPATAPAPARSARFVSVMQSKNAQRASAGGLSLQWVGVEPEACKSTPPPNRVRKQREKSRRGPPCCRVTHHNPRPARMPSSWIFLAAIHTGQAASTRSKPSPTSSFDVFRCLVQEDIPATAGLMYLIQVIAPAGAGQRPSARRACWRQRGDLAAHCGCAVARPAPRFPTASPRPRGT